MQHMLVPVRHRRRWRYHRTASSFACKFILFSQPSLSIQDVRSIAGSDPAFARLMIPFALPLQPSSFSRKKQADPRAPKCTHVFGSHCISTWLHPAKNAQNTCPICRVELFEADPKDQRGDGGSLFVDAFLADGMLRDAVGRWSR